MEFRSGKLGGQFGGLVKSGKFVCRNDTVCLSVGWYTVLLENESVPAT